MKYLLALSKNLNLDPANETSWQIVMQSDSGRYFEFNNLNSYTDSRYSNIHTRDVREIIKSQQIEIRELRAHLHPQVLTEHVRRHGKVKELPFEDAKIPLMEMMKCLDVFKASLDGEHSLSCGDDIRNQNQLWMYYQQLKNLGY
tara:strand:+ start:7644 stop:8075 length:432 start_codon:yes stop_codon:yes gene_type:complete